MGDVKWNKGQKAVLDSLDRDTNLLVSAAAGSGKTAVLVERIIRSVEAGKCEIDQILVMTFTKAAAAQMKGKIIEGLERRAYESGNPALLTQLSKAANADISTIDSFCNRVVRENFQMAGIDPGFKTMDNGERELLREEILDRVLDMLYKDPDFRRVASLYTSRAYDDKTLRNLILQIERKAESFADPEAWLEKAVPPEGENIFDLQWVKDLLAQRKRLAKDYADCLEALKKPFLSEEDPGKRETAGKICEVFDADQTMLLTAARSEDPISFSGALKSKKKSFQKKEYMKVYPETEIEMLYEARTVLWKQIDKLVISLDAEELAEEIRDCRILTGELIRAVREFMRELALEKKRLKKYDFGDIAHAAYHILYDTEKGEVTPVGKTYSDRYRYIYIDEYQDGTDMQEHIMNSVARYRDGAPCNIFMVGDVKQSIYRFRQAKPELFLGKERDYREGRTPGEVLYLNQNYRSTVEILEATNFFFRRLMTEDFGGVVYNEEVQLNPPDGVECRIRPEKKVELLLGDLTPPEEEESGEAPEEKPEEAPEDKMVLEARMIGQRILELVKGDPDHPPVQFSDIVILQRSVKGCGLMIREYEKMGIPVQLEDPKAYFDAEEVVTVLSVLNVIDNTRQDIPYAAVLHSPFGGLTDEDLARLAMRRAYRSEPLFDTAERLIEGGEDDDFLLREKLVRIHDRIGQWKKGAVYLSIAQLIDRILTDTDYRMFAAGLPRGQRRLGNLMRLIAKAEDFEQAGNHGLFLFLRYIEKCRIHDADFGVGGFTEEGDGVRICTIHSSKGLEYPVVFLSRLGNGYNRMDEKGPMVISARYGLAPNHVRRIGNRYIQSTKGVQRRAVEDLEWSETLQEELRLLYVGMTRAKDRLIMTAVDKGICDSLQNAMEAGPQPGELPYAELLGAGSNLEYLMSVILRDVPEASKYLDIRVVDPAEIAVEEKKPERKEAKGGTEKASVLAEQLKVAYNFEYPFAAAVETRTKLSVSEIKHEAMEAKGAGLSQGQEAPRKKGIGGAEYGTAVHKLMELLPFGEIGSRKEMTDSIKKILSSGAFAPELRRVIRPDRIAGFYSDEKGSLFCRMREADRQGLLYKEQQFLIGLPAKRLGQEIPLQEAVQETEEAEDAWENVTGIREPVIVGDARFDTEEPVVLQGIVDAFFLETDEEGKQYVVLMDYKTDRVDSPGMLIDRYRAQLSLYAETVSDILQLPVREMWMYGFSEGLGAIRIPDEA